MLRSIRRKFVLLPPESKAMKNSCIIGLLLLALAVLSCQKSVEYPIEPKITYEGFTYLFNADSTFSGEGIISFSYTDGDGDLGLNDEDTLPPFGFHDTHYYNMVIDYLKSVNGVFVKTPLLSPHVPTNPADTLVLYDIPLLPLRRFHVTNFHNFLLLKSHLLMPYSIG